LIGLRDGFHGDWFEVHHISADGAGETPKQVYQFLFYSQEVHSLVFATY
jgi:hypothetical protein